MVQNIITDLCHHLEIGIDGNLDIGNKRVIVGTPTITLTNNILTISCDTAGASIYYTLDGSTPTSSSTKYTTAVTLNNSCTIKVIAIKGNKSSIVVSQDYIAILTAWRLVGNSVVHTDEYLTQWKVEGNSVVDNNAILSCGDLGQDGKYHVKISNGVTIYDIPLTEPLRKVNDVADSIEFADGVAVVTRNLGFTDNIYNLTWKIAATNVSNKYRIVSQKLNPAPVPITIENSVSLMSGLYTEKQTYSAITGYTITSEGYLALYDDDYNTSNDLNAFKEHINGLQFLYKKETPTTETIQVSPFPISPTDTYTSANDTPYSAFEYKKNVEIWSCGEYSAVDNKWHIRILPEGYGVVDIALDEPLRMTNDVVDSIEFANGVATLTRKIATIKIRDSSWLSPGSSQGTALGFYTDVSSKASGYVLLCAGYNTITSSDFYWERPNLSIGSSSSYPQRIYIKDLQYSTREEFIQGQGDNVILYELEIPTTETIQVPQIEEAESYSMVISQGGKAVSWSSFTPNSN